MNLKFFNDIYQTIEVMRDGFYYLTLLAGIHTVTFAAYLAYKYLNSEPNDDSKKQIKLEPDTELPQPLINMQDINELDTNEVDTNELDTNEVDKKKEYKLLLHKKREELGGLIIQLDTVYDNIGQIRERLENLNNKTN